MSACICACVCVQYGVVGVVVWWQGSCVAVCLCVCSCSGGAVLAGVRKKMVCGICGVSVIGVVVVVGLRWVWVWWSWVWSGELAFRGGTSSKTIRLHEPAVYLYLGTSSPASSCCLLHCLARVPRERLRVLESTYSAQGGKRLSSCCCHCRCRCCTHLGPDPGEFSTITDILCWQARALEPPLYSWLSHRHFPLLVAS